jgi:hypothetical protein
MKLATMMAMNTGGNEPHWSKNPLYLKPTKKQMLVALDTFKSEPVTVQHNCYIRLSVVQPIDGSPRRGHCTRCKRQWERSGPGWTPVKEL